MPYILAYLSKNYNVIAVDWNELTTYPCNLNVLGPCLCYNLLTTAKCDDFFSLLRLFVINCKHQTGCSMYSTGERDKWDVFMKHFFQNTYFQLYSYLTYLGSRIEDITCVGHSLGAHICGMMSTHLSSKQHRIIGTKFFHQNHYCNNLNLISEASIFKA